MDGWMDFALFDHSPKIELVVVAGEGKRPTKLQSVKGTHDRFPPEGHQFKAVTSAAVKVAESFGYEEVSSSSSSSFLLTRQS